MKQSLKFPLINSVALVFMLTMNYLSNTKVLSENNIGDISDKYSTLITPAGYAFSIWGVIFLGLIAFVSYQWYQYAKLETQPAYETAGYWFAISCVLNGLWTFIFLKEWVFLSVLIILGLLFCLTKLALFYRIGTHGAPVRKMVFQWWPITLYVGWIVLATVVNVSSYLVSLGFEGGPLSETTWAVIVLGIAGLIYSLLTYKRNMREASIAGIWGVYGIIAVQKGQNETVVITAWMVIGILAAGILIHAFINRRTNPVFKVLRGEW